MPETEHAVMNYYYCGDFHWNVKGHQAVTDALFQTIVSQGLLPHSEHV